MLCVILCLILIRFLDVYLLQNRIHEWNCCQSQSYVITCVQPTFACFQSIADQKIYVQNGMLFAYISSVHSFVSQRHAQNLFSDTKMFETSLIFYIENIGSAEQQVVSELMQVVFIFCLQVTCVIDPRFSLVVGSTQLFTMEATVWFVIPFHQQEEFGDFFVQQINPIIQFHIQIQII